MDGLMETNEQTSTEQEQRLGAWSPGALGPVQGQHRAGGHSLPAVQQAMRTLRLQSASTVPSAPRAQVFSALSKQMMATGFWEEMRSLSSDGSQ